MKTVHRLSFAFTLAAAVAGCTRSPERPNAATEATGGLPENAAKSPPKVPWATGMRYRYQLKLTSQLAFGSDGNAIDFDLTGTVAVVPTQMTSESTSFNLVVTDGRFTSKVEQAQGEFDKLSGQLDAPYFFTMADGKVTEARVAKTAHPIVAGVYRTLSASLQFAQPKGAVGSWSTTEYDTTGQYIAAYERSGGPNEWRKHKERYVSVLTSNRDASKLPRDFVPEVVASVGVVRLSDAGRPANISMSDELLLKGAQMPIRTRTILTLEADPPDAAPSPPPDWSAMLRETDRFMANEPYASGVDPAVLDDARINGMTFDGIAARLEELAANPKGREPPQPEEGHSVDPVERERQQERVQEDSRLFTALAATFRRKPEAVPRARAKIRTHSLATQVFVDALSSGGSAEAQDALIEIASFKTTEPALRDSAVIALSRTPKPTEKAIATLTALLKDERVGTQALYGLGTFSRRLRDSGQTEPARRLGQLLVDRLEAAKTELRLSQCLRAISNSGYAPALSAVKPLLTDSREQVRVDAVRAIRSMQDPEADPTIATRLSTDSSVSVRLSAVEAASPREPSDALVRGISAAATGDDSVHVRYRATELLIRWLAKRPDARATLEKVASGDAADQIRNLAKAAL